MLKKEISSFELQYKIKNFLQQNASNYTQEEQDFLLRNYTWGKRTGFVPDILRQIYDHLDLLEDEKNIYLGFIDLVKNNFDLDQDIIEVGGGRLPCLGKHIALRQEKGSITVYDPKLFQEVSATSNLILKKEEFTENSDLTDKKLILGFMPCAATEVLLKTACENNIDFMVALCEGNISENEFDLDEEYLWQSSVIYDTRKHLEKSNLGTLEFATLETFDDPYPVLYNKRK